MCCAAHLVVANHILGLTSTARREPRPPLGFRSASQPIASKLAATRGFRQSQITNHESPITNHQTTHPELPDDKHQTQNSPASVLLISVFSDVTIYQDRREKEFHLVGYTVLRY